MSISLQSYVDGLPKAELHVHIEGTLEPELLFSLAQRNDVKLPYADVDALRQAYAFTRLQDFLDIYYQGMQVLLAERDFYDLASAYLRKAHEQNVQHVEVFFDPQGHTSRGVAFDTVMAGLTAALTDATENYGMTSELILCFLRHLDQRDAQSTLDAALDHRSRIIGVGLDSSELGHPPEKFADVFARAGANGFKLVAHAGEEGPPEYVWQALDVLHVHRIDHGNRALEDAALVSRIRHDNIALTVCPLSNLRLCVVDDAARHPIKRMLDLGLMATINSDDPAYFGGYMNENFMVVAEALGLAPEDCLTLAKNAFAASFLSEADKQRGIDRVQTYHDDVTRTQ